MKKIAFYDTKPYDKTWFEQLNPGYTIKWLEPKLNPDTAPLADGCSAVCTFVHDTLDRETLAVLQRLGVQAAALRCAGYNNVDVRAAHGKLPIVRVPAYSPYAVAEHAMAMLLTIVRRTHKAYIRTRDFNFSLNNMVGFDLHGKTVGVIGTGRIGRVFIDICRGFGMNVIAYDARPDASLDVEYTALNDLFRRSDVISLHCPLTDETYHIIDAYAIQYMRPGVVLINTSRGALIDAEVLLNGIKDRRIDAACLDVYEEESDLFFEDHSDHIVEDDTLARLISMPNVLITSHQAFLTEEALDAIARITIENISAYFKDGSLPNQVRLKSTKT